MNFLAVKIIVLASIYSVNVKIYKKSGKYAEKSIMIYIELSDIMSKVLAFKCKYN